MKNEAMQQQVEATVLSFHQEFGRTGGYSYAPKDVERFVSERLQLQVKVAFAPKTLGRILYTVTAPEFGTANFPVDVSGIKFDEAASSAFLRWRAAAPPPILATPAIVPKVAKPVVGQAHALHDAICLAVGHMNRAIIDDNDLRQAHLILRKALMAYSEIDAAEEAAQSQDARRWRAVEGADHAMMTRLRHATADQRPEIVDQAIAQHASDVLSTRPAFESERGSR